jgi:hypothetical protein
MWSIRENSAWDTSRSVLPSVGGGDSLRMEQVWEVDEEGVEKLKLRRQYVGISYCRNRNL